jgi:hypothetical protein
MKIEVLVTLKGNVGELYYKGDVFESPNIPDTLLVEVNAGVNTVRVIEDTPVSDLAPASPLETPVEEVYSVPEAEQPPPVSKVVSRLRKK